MVANDFSYSSLKSADTNCQLRFEYFRNARQKNISTAQASRRSFNNSIGDQVQLLPIDEERQVKTKTANFLWAVTKANFAYFMAGTVLRIIYDVLLFVAPQLLE